MRLLCTLTGIVLTCASTAALAKPDPSLDRYAKPGERVGIGQRRLNLRCSGEGAPVVILESGAVADSQDWSKVLPDVATFTRVCAYDRAGYGFSDGGAKKNYIAASADDLHALIRAAHLATPVVVVGHSLGSDIVRDYARRYASDVAALVLVDPPPQDIQGFTAAQRREHDEQNAGMLAMLGACRKEAATLGSDSAPPELQSCIRQPNPDYSATLNNARRDSKRKAAFWDSAIFAITSGRQLDTTPVSSRENHGDVPLLILQPDSPFDNENPDDRAMLEAARQRTQHAIAATSTRGRIIAVAHSTHDVQFDQPAAIVAAIRQAIAETKKP